MRKLIELAERGLLPDTLIRFGIRQLLRRRLRVVRTHATAHQQNVGSRHDRLPKRNG